MPSDKQEYDKEYYLKNKDKRLKKIMNIIKHQKELNHIK